MDGTDSKVIKILSLLIICILTTGKFSSNTLTVYAAAKSTSYVSGFSYTIYCSGTLVPTQAGSVYTSLKAN